MRSLFRRYTRRNLRLATMGSIGGAAVAYEVYRRRDINQTTPLLDMIRKDGLNVMSNSVAVATSSSKDDFPVYTREEVAKHTTPDVQGWSVRHNRFRPGTSGRCTENYASCRRAG